MESNFYNNLYINIEKSISQCEDYFVNSLSFTLLNNYEYEIFDISIFLFSNENIHSTFSKCIKQIPQMHSKENVEFVYNYNSKLSSPPLFSRIIFRINGEASHRFINVDINDSNRSIDSFVSLLKIRGFRNLISVIPITNGISYTNFGTILDTFVYITYHNYSNEILKYELCNSTLLKGKNSLSLNNISYGKFLTQTFGNSILLEIPIIIK